MFRSDRSKTAGLDPTAELAATAETPATAPSEDDPTTILKGLPLRAPARISAALASTQSNVGDDQDETLVGASLSETGQRVVSSADRGAAPSGISSPSSPLVEFVPEDSEPGNPEGRGFEERSITADDSLRAYGNEDETTNVADRPANIGQAAPAVHPTLRAEYRAPPTTPGLLAGRYRILSTLGTGGMGVVYEAEHVELGKRVAVKVLNVANGPTAELAARFKREARSTSSLDHDHIVQVFDAGEDPAYGLFMVMELLKGEDLEQVITSRGALPPLIASRIVHQVCLALEAAHNEHILHRDLKPANIFLARGSGEALRTKIVDFGLAKFVRDVSEVGRGNITRAGIVLGTPQYMSPEQAQGLDGIDGRTDIYALGAVFYEALVGSPLVPEYASYERTLYHIISRLPRRVSESVPSIPPAIDELVAAMLLPMDLRVATARAVIDRLHAVYPDLERTSVVLPAVNEAAPQSRPISGVVGNDRRDHAAVPEAPLAPNPRYAAALARPSPSSAPPPPRTDPPSPLVESPSRRRPQRDLTRTLLICGIALSSLILIGLIIAFLRR